MLVVIVTHLCRRAHHYSNHPGVQCPSTWVIYHPRPPCAAFCRSVPSACDIEEMKTRKKAAASSAAIWMEDAPIEEKIDIVANAEAAENSR